MCITPEVLHTICKFKTRFNIVLSTKNYFKLIKQIRTKKAKFIRESVEYKQVWHVRLNGKNYMVIFCPIREKILTVLPDVYLAQEKFNDAFNVLRK